MSSKKAFLIGALIGAGLAGFLLLMVRIRPFPVETNAWLERATFKLCPFYMLMFMNVLRSVAGVVIATILGNAILYGILGILLAQAYRLLRWTAGSVPR